MIRDFVEKRFSHLNSDFSHFSDKLENLITNGR